MPSAWIIETWFAPRAFGRLNDQTRGILVMSLETGARRAEIHNMTPDAITGDARPIGMMLLHRASKFAFAKLETSGRKVLGDHLENSLISSSNLAPNYAGLKIFSGEYI